MVSRHQFLSSLAASPFFATAIVLSYGCARPERVAETTFQVLVDGPVPVSAADNDLAPHAEWAHLEQGARFAPHIESSPAKSDSTENVRLAPIHGMGAKRDGGVSVALTNTGESAARLELTVPLAPGLWRAEVAVVSKAESEASPPPLRTWRLESVFQKIDSAVRKTLPLAPGHTLLVRWTETGGEAAKARRRVREACGKTSNSVLQDRVSRAMEPIDDTLAALPELIRRGERDKIVKRIHTALLVTAKAQALWQNWRDTELVELDTAFSDLVGALSEVSCAACNLVPSQTVVTGADGKPSVRLSLANAGPRTIPLVALGLSRKETSANSDLKIFRQVPPGTTVTTTFPLPSGDVEDAHGIVQFISDMGAAVVDARPAP